MFSSSTIQPRRQNSERSDDQDCSAWYVLLLKCLCSRRGKIYKSTLLLSLYVLGRIVAFGFFIYGDINKRAQTFRRLKFKNKERNYQTHSKPLVTFLFLPGIHRVVDKFAYLPGPRQPRGPECEIWFFVSHDVRLWVSLHYAHILFFFLYVTLK